MVMAAHTRALGADTPAASAAQTEEATEANANTRLITDEIVTATVQSRIISDGSREVGGHPNHHINDEDFIRALNRLKELRSVLIEEALHGDPGKSEAFSLGHLNLLRHHDGGRQPTVEEWQLVEKNTDTLFLLMTPPLRRKFLLGEIPWMVAWLPIIFTGVALLSLILSIATKDIPFLEIGLGGANIFAFYLIWLMSLGAIGSLAFIGMNVLSLQEDITFDITNNRLMILRITLGSLFGLVLTVPFGFEVF
jgi:hypothetical protein